MRPEDVKLTTPVAAVGFTGWNDAGMAASTAIAEIAQAANAELIAEIDPELFTDFATVRPSIRLDGPERDLVWPTVQIFAAHLPGTDALFVVGPEPSLRWRLFTEQILELFELLGTKLVVALGALLAEVPHTRPTQIIGVGGDEATVERFNLQPSHYEGPTGIVGVLVTAARSIGLSTASLWAAVPSYAGQIASPAAANALIDQTCQMMGTPSPQLDLERQLEGFSQRIDELIAEDEALGTYVARLEAIVDDETPTSTRATMSEGDLDDSTGASLAAEVEQFLRERGAT